MKNEKDLRNMVDELMESDTDKMTAWEMEFTESVYKRSLSMDYTEKQAAVIERIWDKVFG